MNIARMNRKRIELLSWLLFLFAGYLLRGRVLGDIGIGFFAAAYALYLFWWILLGEGVSENTARMIRNRMNKGQRGNVLLIRSTVFLWQAGAGLAGGVLLGASCARLLPRFFGMGEARYLGWFLLPCFLLRSLGEALLGYCSGRGSERPGMIAALLRGVLFLVLSLLLAGRFSAYGEKVGMLLRSGTFAYVYGCYGVCAAAALTELAVCLFLCGVFAVLARTPLDESGEGFRTKDRAAGILFSLESRRGMDLLNQLLLLLPALFWLPMALAAREAEGGLAAERAGGYLAGFGMLLLAAWLLGAAVSLPLCVMCSGTMKKDEMRHARGYFQSGFHISVIAGAFGMAYLAALGNTIAAVVDPAGQDVLGNVIFAGSIAALFAVPAYFFWKLMSLRGQGVFTAAVTLLAFLTGTFALRLMLRGALQTPVAFSYALDIYLAVLCIGYAAAAAWRLRMNYELIGGLAIPLVASILAGLVNLILAKAFAPHLGNLFSAVLLLLMMFVLYLVVLLLLRNFGDREIRALPGGKWIEALGQMLHVL